MAQELLVLLRGLIVSSYSEAVKLKILVNLILSKNASYKVLLKLIVIFIALSLNLRLFYTLTLTK